MLKNILTFYLFFSFESTILETKTTELPIHFHGRVIVRSIYDTESRVGIRYIFIMTIFFRPCLDTLSESLLTGEEKSQDFERLILNNERG